MISYKKIGHFGRLGNQLFQLASTIGIAKKVGTDCYFPIENTKIPNIEEFTDGITRNVFFDIPKYFTKVNNLLIPIKDITCDLEIHEQSFHFLEDMFNVPHECNLRGYFQSEKYFKHCEAYIRDLLTFENSIQQKCKQLFPKITRETVSIHIRVGDYVGLQQFHPIMDSSYYHDAINQFCDDNYETDKHFLVFSDNIDYAKSVLGEGECITYMENNSTEIDLCLMSMCDHNIIANSSYSWWGAWLNNNKDKKVVAPKKWFGPAYSHNTKDLYCEKWIIV